MKKSNRTKAAIVAVVMTGMLAGVAFGCSSTSTSGSDDATTSDSSDYATLYSVHAESEDGIAAYHISLGYTCVDCHGDDLTDQIATLTDVVYIEGTEEPELASTYYTDTETCLTSGCHDSWEALAESTSDLGDYNPHDSIHGTIEDCNECHKGHASQVDICGECHDNGGQTMLF